MDNHFDAVVCTHLYGMEAMTAILKRKPSLIPCYGVLTDYTCIPFTGDTRLNGYFIPHEDMKQYLIDNCVREEYIHVTGIPVDSRFEKVENRLDKIDIRFEKLETRLDKIDLRLERIDNRLESVENQVESVAMGLNKIDLKVSSLDKKKLRRTY